MVDVNNSKIIDNPNVIAQMCNTFVIGAGCTLLSPRLWMKIGICKFASVNMI